MSQSSPTAAAPGLILIADDNPEARRMLEVRVKREGHQAVLVENGRQALDVLAAQPIDVVLLDIEMPEVNGYEVLRAVKADPLLAHVPVLVISGGGDQDDLVRCIEMGAVDFLPKPFNQALLRARLTSCLAAKRQRDRERQAAGLVPDQTAQARAALTETSEWRVAGSLKQEARQPAPAETRVAVPARIGRIIVQRVLGWGAMGQVYLGLHDLLDLPVAVKVMRPELTATEAARLRLLQEARMLARIAHRHIVRLLEVGEFERSVYLAFEYIAGGTLAELLDRQPGRQCTLATALRVVGEAASALSEANQLGITHRDIKPANLLLTPEGAVKVADFGLAKQTAVAAQTAPQLTAEGAVSGTPLYMAPEQLTLGARLDVRTDLYALGCVLYEMLVGHAPFGKAEVLPQDASGRDIFYHVLHTQPPAPQQFRADLPPHLAAVCMKLLAKRPEDRFATPEALLSALS